MISIEAIDIGDKFKVINDGPTKISDSFRYSVIDGEKSVIHILEKGSEFEVIWSKKKVPGTKTYSFKIKRSNDAAHVVDIPFKEISLRCAKIYPEKPKPTLEYTIIEVCPKVFLVEFKNEFDLAMTFLRYQECYESTSVKFKNQSFKIVDYMKWYAKTLGKGSFTYVSDWSGFNIPSTIIDKNMEPNFIKDWNEYDDEMKMINDTINKATSLCQYYLIGAVKSDELTLKHEVAHGLWFTNADYRANINYCIDNYTSIPVKDAMFTVLRGMGYAESVLRDEMQAYMCAGLTDDMLAIPSIAEFKPDQYISYYKEYTKDVIFNIDQC